MGEVYYLVEIARTVNTHRKFQDFKSHGRGNRSDIYDRYVEAQGALDQIAYDTDQQKTTRNAWKRRKATVGTAGTFLSLFYCSIAAI